MEKKKLFVVSDIHGCATKLREGLKRAGYDRKDEKHLFVCCGDLFDRGDENLEVLKFVDSLERKVLIRGNHEDMLLKIFDTAHMAEHNFYNGTLETMTEFFGRYAVDRETGAVDFSGRTSMVDRVTGLISEMKDYFETQNYVFVHGWLPVSESVGRYAIRKNWRTAPGNLWAEARTKAWVSMYDRCSLLPHKKIVCGHYPTVIATGGNPDIFFGKGVIAIDGGAAMGNRVNVLVLEDELI